MGNSRTLQKRQGILMTIGNKFPNETDYNYIGKIDRKLITNTLYSKR